MANNHTLGVGIKFCLFIVSYFPLLVIMGILHYDQEIVLYLVIIFASVGFIGLGIAFYVFNHIGGIYKKSFEIKSTSKLNFEYFLAYIIPFVALDVDSNRQLVSYFVLITFICILYIRTGLLHVNPTLILLGYNLFKIKTDDGEALLITKHDPENTINHQLIPIDRSLYFERKSISD